MQTGAEETRSMPYTTGFRASMVQKLATPGGPSATQLAAEVGVPQSTLSRWLRQAGRFAQAPAPRSPEPSPEAPRRPMPGKRPQDWSAEEKLQVLVAAAAVPEAQLGGFLRRQGLHAAQLQDWRQQVLSALQPSAARRAKTPSPEARRLRELERELARKDQALAEAAVLLVLKKKARAIWGDEDDDTDPKNGRAS